MSEKTYTSNMPGTPDMSHYQQFVLERANMTDPFTDYDYNSCIEALKKNNAVAINWKQGGIVRQLQLVSKTNLGALTFSCTRKETVESWTVAATSPHTITYDDYDVDNNITPLVNTGTKIAKGTINGQQFELFAPSGGGGGSQVQLVQHSQQVSIRDGAVSSERYNLNVYVPAGKRFAGTLTLSSMHTSQGSGAYQYTLNVPGASMTCIFGTYPAIPQSGHTIGVSVNNSGDTQFQLYFELSGTFVSQNVNVYINGIVF